MTHRILLAALFVCSLPCAAAAATIDFTGVGRAEVVTVAGVRNVRAWAGELTWHWVDGKPAGWEDNFHTYCVDILHNLADPQVVDTRSTNDMPDLARARNVAWLFNTYAPDVRGASGTNAMGAGLQLAIWEVLYDTDMALASGTFRVTEASANALGFGATYLDALALAHVGSSKAVWLDTHAGQDQILGGTVPEPTMLLLFGAGMAMVASRLRKWRRA